MLHLTFSNRYEALQDALLDALADRTGSPLAADHIIIPSFALRRQVELAIADRFGICANVEFAFLAQWLWRQMSRLIAVGDASPFAPGVLIWRIFELLGDERFAADHPRLRHYLRQSDPLMRYELAQRVAGLFDQYITYRPDWLEQWSDGKPATLGAAGAANATAEDDQRWQAAIWRRLMRDLCAARHHPFTDFVTAMREAGPESVRRAGIPELVHVFCLPTIPPLYLSMLGQLGRFVDVRLSVLNPSREYWFDIVDPRRVGYLASRGKLDHHEVGNRLLAAWGKQRQSQLRLLFGDDIDAEVEDDRFVEAGGASVLARVQNSILDLRDLSPGSLGEIDADDRSVEVHVCHSFTRELEVLHDYLLDLFAAPAAPRPGDVLVVTPSLEEAAPLIDAVFGTVERARRIPYSITGRGRSTVNVAARAVLDVLRIVTSRFTAPDVLNLLQQPIVARRFGTGTADLDYIRAWVHAAGVRWGVDAPHREQCGVPPFARHSFEDGLQRLFLGYASPDAPTTPLAGRLPAGHVQGMGAVALGALWAFVRELVRMRTAVAQPKRPADWMQALLDVTTTFLAPDETMVEDAREVDTAIGELHRAMSAGSSAAVPLDVVRVALEDILDDPTRGGVPAGSVTFASMSSLRNLPYRLVCIVGVNDAAFPGNARPAEFDLMAAAPRPGDRQRGEDDRNVFLDLLLSARGRLYVSYVGRSVRDNASLPPSVLVSELLDALVTAIAPVGATDAEVARVRRRLVVEHPLQPFSILSFEAGSDVRIRSFNGEYCEALRRQLRVVRPAAPAGTAHRPAPEADATDDPQGEAFVDEDKIQDTLLPFFETPLERPGEEWRTVELDQLTRFFRNPSRYLLERRLEIRVETPEDELSDREPFVADWLCRNALAERLLPAYLRGSDHQTLRALAHAGTEYPPGRLGELLLERELQHLDEFAAGVVNDIATPPLPPLDATIPFDLDGEAWTIHGALGDVRPGGLVRHRYDDARPVDYLYGWITHLFLNAAAPAGVTPRTRWHSRDGVYTLPPYPDAHAQLTALLQLYRQGLRAPLHFFPRSSWTFMTGDEALMKASGKWHGNPFFPGEKADWAHGLALRGQEDAIDSDFQESAKVVIGPLLAVIDDPRLRT